MLTTTQQITADDLLRMPQSDGRYELIEGGLIVREPAGHRHGRVAFTISRLVGNHVAEHDLGSVYAAETGFLNARNPDTVRTPDVAYVRRERVEEIGDGTGYFPGTPDLAVEVISPGDSFVDVEAKALAWLASGSRMVLTVNPENRTVTLYRSLSDISILTEELMLDGGDVVPGWRVMVRDLFR